MMSAVQPFISGAISKTVNMPEEATVEEIEQLHMESWKLGLKAVAIYRDNCKVAQPLSMAKKDDDKKEEPAGSSVESINDKFIVKGAVRRQLPKVRSSKTFSFRVADSKGFFTVGEFEDGTPGELFISTSKHGSTLRGLIDAFAISISYGLQYGVPLKAYIRNFSHMSFAPSGITDDPDIRTASSMVDYIFRKLGKTYLSFDDQLELGLASIDDMPDQQTSLLDEPVREETIAPEANVSANEAQPAPKPEPVAATSQSNDRSAQKNDDAAPMCFNCGNQTQKAGSCYVCTSCGSTTGCS
ncbi:vitamin B12-dependent ribonucleotide reductase, partial [Candidatus Saccharibacteria bacterium]|nr:vitamin B12-dependent ribonucleotide reductase [Candidatus Saccharibacteria bacterium]